MTPATAAFKDMTRNAPSVFRDIPPNKPAPAHLDVAASLHALAESYRLDGRIDHAEELHENALKMRMQRHGDQHPLVATSLLHLADHYQSLNRRIEAEPLYRMALCIRQRELGPWHPDVAACLDRLASLYRGTGRETDAAFLAKRAATIRAGKPPEETLFPYEAAFA